ncbi:MAG: hypothetical protein ACLGG8_10365 [Gammaproteobacteria bacterium]
MKTVDDIKGRCVVDTITGCWIWRGAVSREGQARIWQYDFNAEKMAALPGKKAMWYAVNQKPLPEGWRVYGTCNCQACMNWEHIKAGTTEQWGQHMSASGIHKGNMARTVAARRTGVKRSVMTAETLHEVLTSKETGRALARRLGISEQTVSKARTGRLIAFSPIASPFAGLGAR